MNLMTEVLSFYRLHKDAPAPFFATPGSACFDLHCMFDVLERVTIDVYHSYSEDKKKLEIEVDSQDREFVTIYRGIRAMIPTGLIFDIPAGYSVRLHSRSGLALKNGIVLVNQEAVIDSDYVHETFVVVKNISDVPYRLYNKTRICQGELVKNVQTVIEETATCPSTETRTGGFGSTGV